MFDFDAFRRERNATSQRVGPQVRIGGEVYSLPPSLPAVVALDILRIRREMGDGATFPPDVLNDLGDALFPEGLFRQIVATNNLDLEDLGDLIVHVLTLYNEGQDLPNRETRRQARRSQSSTIGSGSKRISSGSTGSTSSRK